MAKEEEVNMEEVEVKVVAEADVLVWIGARQRGRSSTLLDSFRLESNRLDYSDSLSLDSLAQGSGGEARRRKTQGLRQ